MKRRNFFFVICVFLHAATCAQQPIRELKSFFSELKTDPLIAEPLNILSDPGNEDKMLRVLEDFIRDDMLLIRSKAYGFIKIVGTRSGTEDVRAAAIGLLIRGIEDVDRSIQLKCVSALTGFKRNDFADEAKDRIGKLIKSRTFPTLIQLAGFLDLNNTQGQLNDLLVREKSAETRWAVRLSLARMDDQPATNFILARLNNLTIDDTFVDELLPDLVYTRNQPVFEFLESIVMRDERNCSSPNPNVSEKIPCAYAVIEAMAPVIKDFPVDILEKTQPYDMQVVQEWFGKKTTIEIIRDAF